MVAVSANLLTPIHDGVNFEEAAFVTLGAIAMQGVRLASLELGEQVVIYGLGLVGMLVAQLVLAAGCRPIGVDVNGERLARARALGIDALPAGPSLAAAILEKTGGFGADKVLLCAATTSNDPIEAVPALMRQKGVLVVV